MEFRSIKRLLTVAELGNFSLAANKLHVSQPALSRSIQQLEAAYDAELIERTPAGVRLTRIGSALEPIFREILFGRERIISEIKRYKTSKRWQASFGACLSIEDLVMPLTLAKLQQHNPHLDIKIHTGLITDLIPRVASGELEFSLGVNASPLSIKLGDKFGNIEFERIVDDRLVIIASRSHPLCQRPHVSIDELSASGWIVPRISSCSMPALNKVFNLDTATHPRNIVTVETAVLAKSTVAQSQFLTLMAELNVQKEIAAGDIVILNVPDFNAPIEIGFFFNRGTMLSELATWSRDALRQGVMDAKLESSKLKKLTRT